MFVFLWFVLLLLPNFNMCIDVCLSSLTLLKHTQHICLSRLFSVILIWVHFHLHSFVLLIHHICLLLLRFNWLFFCYDFFRRHSNQTKKEESARYLFNPSVYKSMAMQNTPTNRFHGDVDEVFLCNLFCIFLYFSFDGHWIFSIKSRN